MVLVEFFRGASIVVLGFLFTYGVVFNKFFSFKDFFGRIFFLAFSFFIGMSVILFIIRG